MKNWRTSSIRKNKYVVILVLLILAAFAGVLSISFGAVFIPFPDVVRGLFGMSEGTAAAHIIVYARLPRTCGCLLAGMALAVSGTIIQSVLANPLAAPNIIGVNAGAGFMVALFSALVSMASPAAAATAVTAAPIAAFLGALGAVLLVLFIAQKTGASRMTVVLAGVAVSGIFNAGIDAIITFEPNALNGYTDFRIGGFSNLSMAKVVPAFWVILAAMLLVLSLANEMDVLALGTETAQSLGLSAKKVRILLLTLAAALAGAAVSFSGLIGFVGLIVPHMMRRIVGEESRPLLLASALGGAFFVTACDLLARLLFRPYELPVGIVLSMVGGPFFLWLLFRQRQRKTEK